MGNLWLIGMMGSGKSTVGRRIASTTDRGFVDVDSAVEERAGKSIARIVDEQGEAAFREMESAEIQPPFLWVGAGRHRTGDRDRGWGGPRPGRRGGYAPLRSGGVV